MDFRPYLLFFLMLPVLCFGQEVIELPTEDQTAIQWTGDAREFFSSEWNTQVVTNVSQPSLEVFPADPAIANGTAVIVAPGGGLFALAVEKEGKQVAKWLNGKGITAFVLKYRLWPTDENGIREMPQDQYEVIKLVSPVLELAVTDGKNAVSYVRQNARRWNIDPKKIGFLGFSAGGAVTMGVALNSKEGEAPDFIIPVYPWMPVIGEYEIPEEIPPMLVICASDDPLLLGPDSIDLYSKWIDEGGRAGLHMYSQGGHGFGMDTQGLPSDTWIDRFYEWAVAEKLVDSKSPQ